MGPAVGCVRVMYTRSSRIAKGGSGFALTAVFVVTIQTQPGLNRLATVPKAISCAPFTELRWAIYWLAPIADFSFTAHRLRHGIRLPAWEATSSMVLARTTPGVCW